MCTGPSIFQLANGETAPLFHFNGTSVIINRDLPTSAIDWPHMPANSPLSESRSVELADFNGEPCSPVTGFLSLILSLRLLTFIFDHHSYVLNFFRFDSLRFTLGLSENSLRLEFFLQLEVVLLLRFNFKVSRNFNWK